MLEVRGLTQRFGGITALEDISFAVAKGEITGVIGPNGAGKTTLFNIVTGIYAQTSGVVVLESANNSTCPDEKLAVKGLVRTFQNIELFGNMTVLENVMLGMHTRSHSGILACMFKMPWHLREERIIR